MTKPLLDVLQGRAPARRPIWFMRQAGRYLEEYRAVRARAGSFLDLCYAPDMAAEVTLQPLRRFDIDAAILFADILLIPQALGAGLEFRQNEGPVLERVGSADDVARLKVKGAAEQLSPVYETVAKVRAGLAADKTLIGFCGAPWTVATYMIEGGTSPDRANARLAAHRREGWLNDLVAKLVESSIDYLSAQIEAGAEVVQIFDTWAGDLPDTLIDRLCFEPIAAMRAELKRRHPDVPVIGFARGVGAAHKRFARVAGVDAVGLEWSVPVDWAARELAPEVVVQGNLDPLALTAGGPGLTAAVRHICDTLPADRHIFNLGHGIRQETPVEHVEQMIAGVRAA